jgi:hypothetical protein
VAVEKVEEVEAAEEVPKALRRTACRRREVSDRSRCTSHLVVRPPSAPTNRICQPDLATRPVDHRR